MKKNLKKAMPWITVIACYASFGLANWYYGRGTVALLQESYSFLSNEVFAFLIGGLIPFAVFEISVKMFLRPIQLTLRIDYASTVLRLRVFIIMANLVCFGLSFIYFAVRILYVWGSILLQFIVMLAFFIGFLFYSGKKIDKSKLGAFVIQTGTLFLLTFTILTALGIVLTVV